LPATAPRAALLLASTILAIALGGCTTLPAQAPIGPASVADPARVHDLQLWLAVGTHEPLPGRPVFGLGFTLEEGGPLQVPGPEIRVREGDTVRVRLMNAHHTIHWHGLSVPWGMDGVPYMTQSLGDGSFLYEFVARETGTYWYHCHVDVPSHVDLGMFGAIIVEPRDPAQDPPFDREATLFLHEFDSKAWTLHDTAVNDPANAAKVPRNPGELLRFLEGEATTYADFAALQAGAATGTYAAGSVGPRDHYPQASFRYMPRYDTFMINGKAFPETEPVYLRSGETLRLRLVNAGQLTHTVHLHGHHGLVTHKDGYPLPAGARYHADTIGLFPGERYDVYVVGNNPGMWDLHDHGGHWGVGAYAANDNAFPGGMATMMVYEDFTYAKLPSPEPAGGWRSGDYRAFSPRFQGLAPPDLVHRH
jgi:manganese oxidase